ncbi:MAG: bacillithiol biosynthesis cysteine-adding enzyme BshC [Chitinophagaceae bacterium]|nr:MAG: bacillithiol biosynthesis cysteine-adding enzyme BshC [Chitinophagaceae bacterium]
MDCNFTRIAYPDTGYFSKIIVDYITGDPELRRFYMHQVNAAGIEAAIHNREAFQTDRQVLVEALTAQYAGTLTSQIVTRNIEALADNNTFTICTAHQPVIFTGTLYFIYKILHTVKLARECEQLFPGKRFVPVYYMGSEDADLDELGAFYLGTEKLTWNTPQKGAVGRMNTKGLEKIISRIEGEVGVWSNGKELVDLFKSTYLESPDIQTATFRLLNTLFASYGVVILIPDNALLKKQMIPIFRDDLFHQSPSKIVGSTIEALNRHYKVQANPRNINLFYLKEDIRELISLEDGKYTVRNTAIAFTPDEIIAELNEHPERFSPNVILRGLFQERILPNVAFIGGGGETAYWLEFQDLFKHYDTPFPVLVLRNSFLLISEKWRDRMAKLNLETEDIFLPETALFNRRVEALSENQLTLNGELTALTETYEKIKKQAAAIDSTLLQHVSALQTTAIKKLNSLEKKMLRAEKRKFETEERHIRQVKDALFPLNGLQERIDNFIPWYAKYGKDFLDTVYNHSLSLEQEFVVLEQKVNA